MGIERGKFDFSPIHTQIHTIYSTLRQAIIQTTTVTSDDVPIWTGQIGQATFTYSANTLEANLEIWQGQNDSLIICHGNKSIEIHRYPSSNPQFYTTYIKTPEASLIFETDQRTGLPFPDPLGLARAVNLQPLIESLRQS